MGFDSNDYIGGQYLNSTNVMQDGLVGKIMKVGDIVEVNFEKDGVPTPRLALVFVDHDRKLPLNSTNTEVMKKTYGADTDTWLGAELTLTIVNRKYKGELVQGIQVNPVLHK